MPTKHNEAAVESGTFFSFKKKPPIEIKRPNSPGKLMVSSRDIKLDQATIRSKILKRPEGKVNQRYVRK